MINAYEQCKKGGEDKMIIKNKAKEDMSMRKKGNI